jgi:DNA-binding MarR family transcriptional regulator
MNTKQTQAMIDALQLFRELKPDMTVNHVLTFLTLASSDEGVTTEEIQEMLGVTQTSASRNLRLYDHMDTKDVKGLGLADTMMSRTQVRTKVRVPSPAGKAFIKRLEEVLGK